jgi:hypothetical protein
MFAQQKRRRADSEQRGRELNGEEITDRDGFGGIKPEQDGRIGRHHAQPVNVNNLGLELRYSAAQHDGGQHADTNQAAQKRQLKGIVGTIQIARQCRGRDIEKGCEQHPDCAFNGIGHYRISQLAVASRRMT